MINCKYFKYYFGDIMGDRKKIDNTIYSFDIETTSYLILNGKIIPASKYLDLSEDERASCEFKSCMYIWMFSINDVVYYGRTWDELKAFLLKLDYYNNERKIVYVHNLSFEFQYLKTVFKFKNVLARKVHKVMKCEMCDFNIELRCSYILSNSALYLLPKIFNLPVEKKVGDLDYDLLRTSETELTKKRAWLL